jgi:hypothetical protein
MPPVDFVLKAIGLGVLLPGLIAAFFLLAARRAGRWWAPIEAIGGPLALALGFLAGCLAQDLVPLRPARAGWQWIPYLPLLAVPAGWLCARARWPEATFLAMATTAFAAAFPIIPGFNSMRVTNSFWAFALGEASLLLCLVLQRSAAYFPPVLFAAALAACSIAQSIVIMESGWASMAQISGLIVGIMIGAAAAALPRLGAFHAAAVRGMAPGFAAISTGIVFSAYLDSSSDVPGGCYAIVLLAPLTLALSVLPPIKRLSSRWQVGIPLTTLALLLGFAVTRAMIA